MCKNDHQRQIKQSDQRQQNQQQMKRVNEKWVHFWIEETRTTKYFNDILSFLSSDVKWSAHCTSNQESDLYSLLSWYSMKSYRTTLQNE